MPMSANAIRGTGCAFSLIFMISTLSLAVEAFFTSCCSGPGWLNDLCNALLPYSFALTLIATIVTLATKPDRPHNQT